MVGAVRSSHSMRVVGHGTTETHLTTAGERRVLAQPRAQRLQMGLQALLLLTYISSCTGRYPPPAPPPLRPNATVSVQTGDGGANGLSGLNILVECARALALSSALSPHSLSWGY
jgi:hypothetical protein